MRILLHICCGPCAIMPIRQLGQAGHDVTGWFYNPNIHPLAEYLKRRDGAAQVAKNHAIPILFPEAREYDVAAWCKAALAEPGGRCLFCRVSRFDAVAAKAKALGFDAFTSSLLYSRHQNHDGMREAGENAARVHGVSFFYQDFRPFWQEGIAASKGMGIYRQQYCGCVFSEEDRYARDLEKAVSGGA